MQALYYIGGPWDQVKEPFDRHPPNTRSIRKRELPEIASFLPIGPETSIQAAKDHIYLVRQVGREAFVAIHEDLA